MRKNSILNGKFENDLIGEIKRAKALKSDKRDLNCKNL